MNYDNCEQLPPLEEIQFEGTTIKIGKRSFILPPLPVTRLHRLGLYKLQGEIEKAQLNGNIEIIGEVSLKLLEVIYQALKMNYPNITKEESIELITTKQLFQLIPALIDTPEGLEEAKNV